MSTDAGGTAPAVGQVFDAARAGFLAWSPLLWDPIGAATIAALAPSPGEHVLDACCGAGAATLPAARAVGAAGRVDGVDLAEQLLAAGRERAAWAGLNNTAFHAADVTRWRPPDRRGYDVVSCVFGVFFLPDLDAGGAHLLGLVRPGGRLAMTTWARGSVEPLLEPFARAAAAERAAAGHPTAGSATMRAASRRVDDPAGLDGWLRGLGASTVTVEPFARDIALTGPRAWEFVTGSGARAMLSGLDPPAITRVRHRYLAALEAAGTAVFHARALIGIATRPA